MSADLIFRSAQTYNPNLVFGEDDAPPTVDATISLVASLPALRGAVRTALGVPVSLRATLPALRASIKVVYDTRTDRPLVGKVSGVYQNADDVEAGVQPAWTDAVRYSTPLTPAWTDGIAISAQRSPGWTDGDRLRNATGSLYREADDLRSSSIGRFQEGVRIKRGTASRFQEGIDLRSARTSWFQEGIRDRRNFTAGSFQDGIPYSTGIRTFESSADPLIVWLAAIYEEAMRAPAGIYVRPGPQPPDPCYLPDPNLVFVEGPGGPNLVFVCERHGPGPEPGETVVVPIKRVYMVLNEATLRRVSDNALIPTLSMSMSLDVDSWTWSFSASLPWQALSLVDDAEPTEVQAVINGAPYRFIVEKISTERSFGGNTVRVSGRGKAALLDSPYAASMFFGNTTSRTAQQLMGDVLTLNGVPLDWTVDWNITDWTVPGNVWTHQGSYMSALNNIAAAPGAYIQPHPTDQTLIVLPRYPAMPHQWADLTPDFDIPADVSTREGIERANLAVYDRVFVSGTTAGVLGQVTRAGTSGESVAPMITDPLITHVDAARQRGLAALSPGGRQQNVTLRMPVLEETGIIPPGKLVLYRDGGVERLGFTRSVQVDVGLPEIWQSLGLETYA